ncbi:hypothetical protein Dsin_002467 [Dipteronia sinensis]|uniref:Uncharacterized protein n=1 Tax=Dipteronia sinensis TaxID=43782 RepID=A0AAE0EJF7_9ROSI|nr:hypothetical protein Dsin_002467 [Dipteronia sinensis]
MNKLSEKDMFGDSLEEVVGICTEFILLYQWLVDSLSSGEKVSEDLYLLKLDSEEDNIAAKSLDQKQENENVSSEGEPLHHKKIKSSHEDVESRREADHNAVSEMPNSSDNSPDSPSTASMNLDFPSGHFKDVNVLQPSLPYSPPDLNNNITEIFGKLINIYLGKWVKTKGHLAITKLSQLLRSCRLKSIDSADQVKGLPGIGKSMKDRKDVPILWFQDMKLLLQKAGEDILPGVSSIKFEF